MNATFDRHRFLSGSDALPSVDQCFVVAPQPLPFFLLGAGLMELFVNGRRRHGEASIDRLQRSLQWLLRSSAKRARRSLTCDRLHDFSQT
jgi:hypothetical protein